MKAKTYSILVLLDLKQNTKNLLKYTVALSKKVTADVEFFSVRNPTDVVDTDNQLSAMRNINTDCIALYKELKHMLAPISKQTGVKVKSTFAFGNAKHQIEKRINTLLPDIIILGARKPKIVPFLGDRITEFLQKKYKGKLLIASNPEDLKAIEKLPALQMAKVPINT